MKKVCAFVLNPTDVHLVLSRICCAENILYSLESSIIDLKNNFEKNGEPDLILTDIHSMKALSNSKSFDNIEIKIVAFTKEEASLELNVIELSKLSEYFESLRVDSNVDDNRFVKVSIPSLLNTGKAIVDLFICIQKKGVNKFLLRYPRGCSIDFEELKIYESKGMFNFYVLKSDQDELNNTLSNSLCYDIAVNNCLDSMKNGLKFAQILFQEGGYSPASIQLIEELNLSLYNKLEEEAKSSPQVSIIKNILASKGSVYFKKVSLQSVLGMDILKKETWSNDHHYETFSFMALFSDIGLTKSEMIFVSTEEEFDRESYSKEDAKVIEKHASVAFKLLKNYKSKPVNVDLLILEHHGVKSGVGFSENFGVDLNKMVIISRVAESIAIEILKKERDQITFNMEDIIGIVDQKFDSQRVRSTLKSVI